MVEHSRSSFSMDGARQAVSQGLHHIEEQVNAIERAVSENSGLVFDLAKTLVESTCRTILTDRGIQWSEREDLPSLFRKVRDNLPMLPSGESEASDVRESILRIVGGLSGAIHGISELRNQLSFASHGGDKPRPSMEITHAMLAAQSADTIISFLYDIHALERTPKVGRDSAPTRNSDFETFVDDLHDAMRIFDSEFLPSEVLFQMEPDSYRIFLAEFIRESRGSEGEE